MLRGIAAAYVLFHHIRNSMWWATRDVSRSTDTLLYWTNGTIGAMFRFGHTAVLAFFIISGISIHLATLERGSQFSALPYFKRRLYRLYPVLIVSMATSAFCLFFVAPDYFGHPSAYWSALGTLAFQQTVLVEPFAGNTPYWSLANEGYYYAAYPLLLFIIRRTGADFCTGMIIGAGLLITMSIGSTHHIVAYYPLWVAGVLLAERLFEDRRSPTWFAWAGCAILLASLICYTFERQISLPRPVFVQLCGGLGIAALLQSILQFQRSWPVPEWTASLFTKLGDISYPLYVTHFPVIVLIQHFAHNPGRSILLAVISSILTTVSALTLAGLVHWGVERTYLRVSKQEREASFQA